MKNLNTVDKSCNIILPTSTQITFNELSFNDKNLKISIFQGNNNQRYTNIWNLTKNNGKISPILFQKNVELQVQTSDLKGILCFTIETIFPLRKSPYKFRFLRN